MTECKGNDQTGNDKTIIVKSPIEYNAAIFYTLEKIWAFSMM